jgi:hypothetical protein
VKRFARTLALGAWLLGTAVTEGAAAVGLGLHAGRDDTLTQYQNFGTWLGPKVTHRVVFAAATWEGISSPWFLNISRQWVQSDPARVEVVSLPMMPATEKGNFAAIISGVHDAKFTTFGQELKSHGIASRVIVRLGWEGNGDWYPWAYAANPSGYRSAFRRVVQLLRTAAPGVRIEWNITCRASRRGGPAVWTEGYPGDDVVDIVSMDVYDEWTTWTDKMNGEAGLLQFREFAVQHNKPEAYTEWGCSTNTSAKGGGDNPLFIENMAKWFAARPGKVVYQAYWNTMSGGPKAAIQGVSPVPVPNAAAAYRRFFTPPAAPSVAQAR